MNTFKTAIVVVALLIVLYGVYTALNSPSGDKPVAEQPFEIKMDGAKLDDPNRPDWANDPDAPYIPGVQGSTTLDAGQPPTVSIPGVDDVASGQPDMGGLQPFDPTASSGDVGNEFRTGTGASGSLSNSIPTDPTPGVGLGGSTAQGSLTNPEAYLQGPAVATGGPTGVGPGAQQQPAGSNPQNALKFQQDWEAALANIQAGEYRKALATLSYHYKRAYLTVEQHQQLLDVLDPLAGKVIYSREHYLFPAYVVKSGDTLQSVAAQYRVPPALLANINGMEPTAQLQAGMELKVVAGPFAAEVDSDELTLFVDELYAGRFPVNLGSNPPAKPPGAPAEGTVYRVRGIENGKAFAVGDVTIPARHPENPYGDFWIDLGGGVGIHEYNSRANSAAAGLGCIGLSAQDAADLANILSVDSEVLVR